jgi:enoyl-[acyl-carrier-protein] reductase (NADH)
MRPASRRFPKTAKRKWNERLAPRVQRIAPVSQENEMREPTLSNLEELQKIESEMTENKASLHGLVHVIAGDHPAHGFTVIVRDDSSGYIFKTPIPPDAL